MAEATIKREAIGAGKGLGDRRGEKRVGTTRNRPFKASMMVADK